MSDWLYVDTDAYGIHTYCKLEDGKLRIRKYKDVESSLEANKASYNEHNKPDFGGVYNRVASIDMIEAERLRSETGLNIFDPNAEKQVRRILNDSDYRSYRTMPGRV